jgi:CheY-like chemotaxis protein
MGMEKHVLVNSRSVELASHIGECLEEAGANWGDNLLVDYAKNQKDAVRRVDTTAYDVIVSEVDLPRDRNSCLVTGEHLGWEFLKDIRTQDYNIPVVLLDASADMKLQRDVQGQTAAEYLARDYPEWDDWIVEVCRKFLTRQDTPRRLRLELDIVMHPAHHYTYHMKVVGKPGLEDQGPLQINQETLERLGRYSSKVQIDEYPAWEEDLRDIGETLGKEIFQGNYKFSTKFREFLGNLESRSDVSIRFNVEKDVHPVMLEALKEAGEHYWMLEAPIYRRVSEFTDRYALFQDNETRTGPLNCLIIEADVGNAMVPEFGKVLGSLENVPVEVRELREFLEKPGNKEKFNIEEVRVLSKEDGESTFEEMVRNTLPEKEWHIVHYAGHSYYDKKQQTGYVFFPGKKIATVKAETFANWLNNSHVRFLFLSSCRSSEEDFIFAMANNMVPAIVGFRWEIEDDMAAKYTQCFYTQLFQRKSLEYAFFKTRRLMHAEHQDHPIWASPVLVIQAKRE